MMIAFQFIVNLILSVIWLLLTGSYTLNNFVLGLIKPNIDVLKIILRPKINNHPGFFVYNTDLKTDWQIVLLSNLITLTPGTVVLGISDDRTKIYIHAIDFSTKEEEVASIKSSLEKVVREVGNE